MCELAAIVRDAPPLDPPALVEHVRKAALDGVDALDDVGTPDGVPDDDKAYPYEVIADLMVMDVSDNSSIAVVVNAVVEIGKGEKVLVRRPAR